MIFTLIRSNRCMWLILNYMMLYDDDIITSTHDGKKHLTTIELNHSFKSANLLVKHRCNMWSSNMMVVVNRSNINCCNLLHLCFDSINKGCCFNGNLIVRKSFFSCFNNLMSLTRRSNDELWNESRWVDSISCIWFHIFFQFIYIYIELHYELRWSVNQCSHHQWDHNDRHLWRS